MAEYIDRLDAYLAIGEKVKEGRNALNNGLAAAIDAIGAIPAADVAPVKHGRWNDDGSCSVCGRCDWDNVECKYFLHCPNCGAKMDGGNT